MSARPNFTSVHHTGGTIVLRGTSDPTPDGDIVSIQVVLSQSGQSTPASVDGIGGEWSVAVAAEGFNDGTAVAVGIETRRENATTITWAQAVEIPESPN